jgi:hypothetical protein
MDMDRYGSVVHNGIDIYLQIPNRFKPCFPIKIWLSSEVYSISHGKINLSYVAIWRCPKMGASPNHSCHDHDWVLKQPWNHGDLGIHHLKNAPYFPIQYIYIYIRSFVGCPNSSTAKPQAAILSLKLLDSVLFGWRANNAMGCHGKGCNKWECKMTSGNMNMYKYMVIPMTYVYIYIHS